MTVGWDDPRTAAAYEAFGERHSRYRQANEVLVAHARLGPASAVLDVGAGIGGTAEVVLETLGPEGHIVCVEPARAMRERGREIVRDARVEWRKAVPDARFDRVLAGASVWQMLPVEKGVRDLAARVAPGGGLVFDVPAAYLGEPDEPGGGEDPMLVALPGLLAEGRNLPAAEAMTLPDAAGILRALEAEGLEAERFEFRLRLTQAAYRDWLKIPPISDRLLAGLSPEDRGERIDREFRRVDPASWRWERWLGFAAWRSR